MKDEIKEILEDVKRHLDYVEATKQMSIRDNEMKSMYDYITNLQEENKRLKHDLEQMYNDTKDTYNEICAEQIDYKARCDKARRCIKNIFKDENWYENYEYNDLEYKLKEVDKILQGDDNNG